MQEKFSGSAAAQLITHLEPALVSLRTLWVCLWTFDQITYDTPTHQFSSRAGGAQLIVCYAVAVGVATAEWMLRGTLWRARS